MLKSLFLFLILIIPVMRPRSCGGGGQRFDLVTFTVSYCCGNSCIDSLAYTIFLLSMFQYVVDFVDSGASDYQEHPLGCYKMGLSF